MGKMVFVVLDVVLDVKTLLFFILFFIFYFFYFFIFFFLIWVLWPFQEYFTYTEPIIHRRWVKTREPREKPPDHL